MATSTKKKPAQTKIAAPRARTTREKSAKKPTKREQVAKLPVVNHHIDAAIGGSNARDLIKKVTEAAASLIEVQHQTRERQQSKPQGMALQEKTSQEKSLQEKPSQDKGQDKPQEKPQAKSQVPSASRAPVRELKRSPSKTMMLWLRQKVAYLGFVVLCGSFLAAAPPQTVSSENPYDRIQAGQWVVASMYWQDKVTSTGKAFKPVGLYAAHKTLPIGTLIRVSNPKNHRSINITVNDRGPYIAGRDLDLTLGAGALLGFDGLGTLYMEVLAIPPFENVKRPLVENLFAPSDADANVNCPTGEKCDLKRTALR